MRMLQKLEIVNTTRVFYQINNCFECFFGLVSRPKHFFLKLPDAMSLFHSINSYIYIPAISWANLLLLNNYTLVL